MIPNWKCWYPIHQKSGGYLPNVLKSLSGAMFTVVLHVLFIFCFGWVLQPFKIISLILRQANQVIGTIEDLSGKPHSENKVLAYSSELTVRPRISLCPIIHDQSPQKNVVRSSRTVTIFCGDWLWNNFYCHSLPFTDSRRAVVSYWRKNVHQVLVNCLGGLLINSVDRLCPKWHEKCQRAVKQQQHFFPLGPVWSVVITNSSVKSVEGSSCISATSWENLFCHMRTTKAQISLRIHTVWSAHFLFAG